ncbi:MULTISPECIES: hypothetical protein [unclassified Burkholderia]|uniref:hypothetical protein n=1 Tax=unclassified Burkholderia TaxID=2613784 RepID=UPI002AB048A1|nr:MULTISPECIES: hypothetical protein [unclassified Burkholderia]
MNTPTHGNETAAAASALTPAPSTTRTKRVKRCLNGLLAQLHLAYRHEVRAAQVRAHLIGCWQPQSQRVPPLALKAAKLRLQRGFSMLEFGIVLVLSTILLMSQISQVSRTANISLATATGQYVAELQAGVNLYVQNFFAQLSTNQPVVFTPQGGGASYTVANPTKPTLADLKGVHVLDSALSATSPSGLTFTNSLTVDPATCPGVNCVIQGLTYSNQALLDKGTGKPRIDWLGQAVVTAGQDAGMSFPSTPGTLTGRSASWSTANPLGNVAGVLAIRTGDLSGLDALLAQFYKLDGSRALTGTMNANSQSIHNVNDLTTNTIEVAGLATMGSANVNGNVNAQQFTLPGGGTFQADQGGSLELGGNNGTTGGGWPYIDFHFGGQGVQDFNARIINDQSNHLSIKAANGQASLGVEGTIQAGNVVVPGTWCPTNGLIGANSDGSGQILSCQSGTWLPIGGRWLQMYKFTVQHGWWIPQPACSGGGVPQILVYPANFVVNDTATVNVGAWASGNAWVTYIVDGSGNPIWSATASASTYCTY